MKVDGALSRSTKYFQIVEELKVVRDCLRVVSLRPHGATLPEIPETLGIVYSRFQ